MVQSQSNVLLAVDGDHPTCSKWSQVLQLNWSRCRMSACGCYLGGRNIEQNEKKNAS